MRGNEKAPAYDNGSQIFTPNRYRRMWSYGSTAAG
jgi:hypothetical protein